MCPYSNNCKMLVTCALVGGILVCSYDKENCPQIEKQPDEPVKQFIPTLPLYSDLAIMTSANAAFIDSGIGEQIGDLPDGSKVFFIKPKDINFVGGTLISKNTSGEEIIIKLEKPESKAT